MEKLNLVKILKDCPKGTKLYSPALGECALEGVNDNNDYPIKVKYKIINNDTRVDYFTKYGYLLINKPDAECMLFPSKDQRDWSKWQRPFVKGDILVSEKGNIVLCSHIDEEQVVHFHCILNFWGNFEIYNGTGVGYSYNCNLANVSQKQRLFDALKKEGYEWDEEKKELKTLQPFKDGDVVTYENQIAIFKKYISEDSGLAECYVFLDNNLEMDIDGNYYVKDFATEEEKQKIFDVIREKGYHWNTESKTLENWTIQDAKEGDVLAINWYEGYDYWEKIIIFKKYHNEGVDSPCVEGYGNTFKNRKLAFHEEVPRFSKTWTSCLEPATKEQRDFLFQTIKEAGYKWNPETKTLEKLIKPNFKDGDIVATNDGKYISIIKNNGGKYYVCCHPNVNYFYIDRSGWFDRLATLEEKEKLFAAIKENGYKWNAKTKTLEKLIVPKFKVGDRVQSKTDNNDKFTITNIDNNKFYYGCGNGHEFMIPVVKQDNWELVPNKFDINTLKPFDKVLVRQYDERWHIQFFETMYEYDKNHPFRCLGGKLYSFCIPYIGNEHLLDTINEPSEFYRYWEE